MISKSANKFAIIMFDVGAIKQEEVDIYKYLFEYIIENLLFFFVFPFCGILFGDILYGLLLYAVIIPLRSFGGGVHAPAKWICNILSYGMVVVVIGVIPFAAKCLPKVMWLSIFVMSFLLIGCLVPVDCPNKRLSDDQKKKLKRYCLISLLLISIAFFIFYQFNIKSYCGIIAVGSLVIAVSDVLGVMVNRKEYIK